MGSRDVSIELGPGCDILAQGHVPVKKGMSGILEVGQSLKPPRAAAPFPDWNMQLRTGRCLANGSSPPSGI